MAIENKTIPFSFCRIKRASDFLGVKAEDLLSLAISGQLILCVKLDYLMSYLFVQGNAPELSEWYSSLELNLSEGNIDRKLTNYSSFAMDCESYNESRDETILNPFFYQTEYPDGVDRHETSTSHHGRAYGLWEPPLSLITSILNHGKARFSALPLTPCEIDEKSPFVCVMPLPSNYEDMPFEVGISNDDFEYLWPDSEITIDDLWITANEVRRLLSYKGDFCDLPSVGIKNIFYPTEQKTKPHRNTERHATNREGLLKSAIHLLSKYPEECRGEKKEISAEKWANCILKYKGEIPPLMITNRDVIINKLREALNGPKA